MLTVSIQLTYENNLWNNSLFLILFACSGEEKILFFFNFWAAHKDFIYTFSLNTLCTYIQCKTMKNTKKKINSTTIITIIIIIFESAVNSERTTAKLNFLFYFIHFCCCLLYIFHCSYVCAKSQKKKELKKADERKEMKQTKNGKNSKFKYHKMDDNLCEVPLRYYENVNAVIGNELIKLVLNPFDFDWKHNFSNSLNRYIYILLQNFKSLIKFKYVINFILYWKKSSNFSFIMYFVDYLEFSLFQIFIVIFFFL